MSQLNINDLPPEMLTKIFRLLDAETLENATLACKLWNNLIESGCRWSVSLYDHRVRQRYFPCTAQMMNFMLTTKRRFGKIRIYGVRLSKDDQIFEIFRRQRFNIVELGLYRGHIHSLVVFAQLLKLTPNLESLDMEMLVIDNVTDVPLHPVLPELKMLKIYLMSPSPIIECFRNTKLTTMHIEEHRDQDIEPFLYFLASQPALTSLTIENFDSSLSPRSILAQIGKLDVQIPFRLTKLRIISLGKLHSSQDHNNLVKFIESQAESLTEVELRRNLPTCVYECVFNSLPKLRTLIVSLDFLPSIPGFYDRLKENRSVCTMKIMSTKSDYPLLGEILKRLPNIRSAIIPGFGIAEIAQHLDRLESLSISYIDSIGYFKFGNLRTLQIGSLLGYVNWNEFTKANPRLVELIIERIFTCGNRPVLTSDDIYQITTNVDLQYLGLGVGFVADDRFFEIIRTNCTNLKVLELHKSCVPQGLRHNVEFNVLRVCKKINCPMGSSDDG